MRRICSFLLFITLSLSLNAQTLIFECGQNSGTNFNGWYLGNSEAFDEVTFNEHQTAFYSEFGGNHTVSLTRKLTGLDDYEKLELLFNFEGNEYCQVIDVIYYISEDGKKWKALEDSQNNSALTIDNTTEKVHYIRAEASAIFYRNGELYCNYVKVEGDRIEPALLSTIIPEKDPLADSFFIFSHLHTLNIETGNDMPYDVLITAISGQIIYRDSFEGSQRIDLPGDLTGLFIVSIIQGDGFKASKKVML